MKRSKKINLIVLVILLFISFILLFCDLLFNEHNKIYQISVITSGKSDESFMILKEGAEQAALDKNANIRFIFLSKDSNEEEQIELIKRESENEVDALIISPIESEVVMNIIENVKKKVPVILIQSLIETKSITNKVVCNEYELGEMLAKEAIENINKNSSIMIVSSNYSSTSSDKRYEGILNILDKSENRYLISNVENYTTYREFNNVVKNNNIGAVICLDRSITENIAELKKKIINEKENEEVLIFGIGNTNKIISLLEEEVINATAVQNEFNIGYISVRNAIALNNGEKIEEVQEIKSTVIRSKDMYSPKNERILFQFVR